MYDAFLGMISVLIIDTGVNYNALFSPYVRYSEPTLVQDHGQAITGLVLSGENYEWVCPRVRVDVCSINSHEYLFCLSWATMSHYDFINISLTGTDPIAKEKEYLEKIIKNTVVVVAAGNRGQHYRTEFPGGYLTEGWQNYFVTSNLPSPSSNYGEGTVNVNGNHIEVWNRENKRIYMSGTSMSAALYTHKLLMEKCNEYTK